jgi:SecD/SecF fusion protein
LLFDFCERKRWLKELNMMQAIGLTNIDFIGKNRLFATISIALILVGLLLVGWRGRDNLDIDFRGGSMATFRIEGETPSVDVLQPLLDKSFGESVAIERLQTTDQPPRTLVRVRSTASNESEVGRRVSMAFEGTPYALVRQRVEVGPLATIGPPASDAPPELAEFAGGQEVQITVGEESSTELLRAALLEALRSLKTAEGAPRFPDAESLLDVAAADGAPRGRTFFLRTRPSVPAADVQACLAAYQQEIAQRPLFEELNTFDQAVAVETQWIAFTAVVISLLATIAYLWFRFQAVDFGVAAVVAVLHDILAVLGVVTVASLVSRFSPAQWLGLTDFKMNLSMVAAYLTIVGYSLNDTIVVFDRIRELRGKSPTISPQMINLALNQTLSRTLLTGVTTLIVILLMYFLGGDGLHGFSFCLFMGIVIGTYSSVYVASPVLLWMMNRKNRRANIRAAAA